MFCAGFSNLDSRGVVDYVKMCVRKWRRTRLGVGIELYFVVVYGDLQTRYVEER
jgi:hypothetical protein